MDTSPFSPQQSTAAPAIATSSASFAKSSQPAQQRTTPSAAPQQIGIENSAGTITVKAQAAEPAPQPAAAPAGSSQTPFSSSEKAPLPAETQSIPGAAYYESTRRSWPSPSSTWGPPKEIESEAPDIAVATQGPVARPVPAIVIDTAHTTSNPGYIALERTPEEKTVDPTGPRPWLVPFFDCLDPIDNCLISWCLPCINYGMIDHRMNVDPTMSNFDPVNGHCMAYGALCCFCPHFVCIPNFLQRQEVRERYNLEGGVVSDLTAAVCCHCCTIAQMEKETALREEESMRNRSTEQYSNMGAMMQYRPSP